MQFDTYTNPTGQLCVRPKHNGLRGHDFFLHELTQVARIPESMGTAVIHFLARYIADAAARGETVTLDGLGTFAPSLTLNKDTNRTKLDGNIVELKRITFRPHPDLKKRAARQMNTHRVREAYHNNLQLPDFDRRRQILERLLQRRTFITSTDYMNATRVSRSLAYRDLAQYEAAGIVRTSQAGRNKFYSLPTK